MTKFFKGVTGQNTTYPGKVFQDKIISPGFLMQVQIQYIHSYTKHKNKSR